MLYRCHYYFCLLLLLQFGSIALGQSAYLTTKLDSLKAKNDLSNWIYEQLDEANNNPKIASQKILKAQKNIWRISENADEHYAWLNLISTLGYYQLLDGNILGSINSYENALSFFRKHQILSYDIVSYVLKPLSNNYTRLGDYERALYLQKQAIEISTDSNEIAAIYSNMAISYRSMGRLTDAYTVLKKGLALKPKAFIYIMLNNIYADVLYDDGRFNEAKLLITTNIKRQRAVSAETAYWLVGAYTTLANIYQQLGQYTAANQQYFKALALLNKFYPGARVRERANLLTKLADNYLSQFQTDKAITYAQQTLRTLGVSNEQNQIMRSNIYGDNMLLDVFMVLAKTYRQLNKPTKALAYINLSLLSADGIRSEFAADKAKERLQSYLKQIVEQGIALSYRLYQDTKNEKFLYEILELAEKSKARTLLDQINRNQQFISRNFKNDRDFLKKEKLERQINYLEKQALENRNENLIKQIEALKFDLALVDKALSKKYHYSVATDNAAIELSKLPKHRFAVYFLGQDNSYIINIFQHKITGVIQIPEAEKLKDLIGNFVKTYFHQGPSAMMNNPKAFFEASNKVYQLIVAPLQLNSGEHLTIIPDGLLGYLSFDGLIAKPTYVDEIANWPYLIKSNVVDYAFSVKTLQNENKHHNGKGFAGLFLTHTKGNQAALNSMATEAGLIRKQVAGKFLFDDEANIRSFNQFFAKSEVLHIGTHAYLSGVNQEPTLDFSQEKLYLFELLHTSNAPSLVVLSACQTADGVLANGEGIISMARGFNAVGTSATIASLWNVNDDAAASITGSFYQYLVKSSNPSTSLREAKLHWLNSTKISNSLLLPYYWDSLIYMGKNQKIELHSHQQWQWLVAVLLFLIAIFASIYLYSKRKKLFL